MSRNTLAAAALAVSLATLVTAGATVAGQAMHGNADRMERFAYHHGMMLPGIDGPGDPTSRPRLGVAISELALAELDAKALEYGVRVERVAEGSIAAAAGLEAGDIVTAVGERPAYSPQRLQHLVNAAKGETSLSLVRGGESLKLSVDLTPLARADDKAALGIRIQDMTVELKEAFGAQEERGVLVAQVNAGSAAAQAGMKAGDVVVAIGDQEVARVEDVHTALAKHAPGDSVTVKILRERAASDLVVTLGAAERHAAGRLGYGGTYKPHCRHRGHGMYRGYGEGKEGTGYQGHQRGHANPGCHSGSMQRHS